MPFTKEQEKAINDQNTDILVSASAGSGKTTVLVQRVLKKVLSGTSVDKLLIVTFTKAAAQEMKQRIKNEINAVLKRTESNKNYLRQQLNLVDTANISTIDAFCLEVIHRFYYVIDLDPSFSILTDETQNALLKEKALRDIEDNFLQNKDPGFIEFYNNFSGDRDAEAARNLLLDLFNFVMAKPDYHKWLLTLPEAYKIEDEITSSAIWKKEVKPFLLANLTILNKRLSKCIDNPLMDAQELAKVKSDFNLFKIQITNLLDLIKENSNFMQIRSQLQKCKFTGKYRKSSKWDEDLLNFYTNTQEVKKEAKSQILDLFSTFFVGEQKDQIKAMKRAERIVSAIVKAELALIDRFSELKREENVIDYNDIEQFAYQILGQDTSTSQLAREFYQDKFDEILVDEYQDINSLQEKIIQTIKKDKKNYLFMVGDVKQSIYGFRQANPSLFLKKYHDFAYNDKNQERILLADNFRSTKPVTKLVNQIFNPVLTSDFGGIDYQKEGQLHFGAQYYPKDIAAASEVIIHEKQKDLDENQEIDFSEIEMVISRIKQFKKENFQVFDSHTGRKRSIKFSDIVILTRSRSDNLNIMQEFAKNNLPLFVTDAQNYFQTFELTIILNYLKIIDNPDQDIPLVSVLRSPIFNFNEKELAKIRINNKKSSFYNALISYLSNNNQLSDKVKSFINQLDQLRKFASNHRISELVWSIYEETNLLEIMTAMPNGEQRRVNLEALYERASSYESAGFKGLYQFINFITRMRKAQKDLAQPLLTKEAGDAVRLMTIHGSKGLEFPIVFYVGMQHHYQMKDISNNFVITDRLLGLTIRNKEYRLDTLVKAVGNLQKKRQLLEEEARILYVALTRAKQKLIIVGDIDHLSKKVKSWQNSLNDKQQLPLIDKINANSALSFIGPTLNFDKQIPQEISEISDEQEQSRDIIFVKFSEDKVSNETKKETKANKQKYDLLLASAKKLFNFKYPFIDASKTTAYQAVSEIKKAFNDPLEKELENNRFIHSSNRYLQPIDTKPNFLFDNKFTGAEIGTATHMILQYYNYNTKDREKQLDDEVEFLIKQKKLNPEIVSSIKFDNIKWFINSDFAKPFWNNPEKLQREIDFSSLLSAKTLFTNFSDPNAKILIHGTIDGYYLDEDGIILFDYKTDYINPKNKTEAISKIKQKYTGQLRLYEQALNEISNKEVKEKYLILLDAQETVKID